MANYFFLSLCFLALFLNGSTAQFGFGSSPWQSSRQGAQRQCRLERLSALEPKRRVQSEGGVTEYFDDNNESLDCVGVSAIRETIQPQGLSLPTYFNAPQLIYVVKGRGIAGGVLPGCPETFQSTSGQQQQQQGGEQQQEEQGQQQRREEQGQGGREQQQREEQGQGQSRQEGQQQREEQGQGQSRHEGQQQREGQGQGGREQQQREEQGQGQSRHEQQQQREEQGQQQREEQGQQRASGDQHQRIIRFSQGDILAVPAGMAHWCYNDGDSPVVVVKVLDTNSNANQLDNNQRKFSLAGQTSEQDERSSNNIFKGFNLQFLADALGVSRELTKKLQQGQNGEIVRVQRGLRVVMPRKSDREEQEGRQSEGRQENGLEQAFCMLKLRENIDEPSHADVYNPQAGRLSWLNGQKLPILNLIQMSAARGVLYRGATVTPHWTINAHTALYVTGGRGRIQIVGDMGRSVFDQEIREGQMVVIPQHFAVVMQAREQQFEWVSFKTHGNAIPNHIVGPGSLFRGLPEDVIAQSYRGISKTEARILKNQESLILPRSQQEKGGRAEV